VEDDAIVSEKRRFYSPRLKELPLIEGTYRYLLFSSIVKCFLVDESPSKAVISREFDQPREPLLSR
jgi:hypothetical protein